MYETVYPFSILLDFVLVFESTSEKKLALRLMAKLRHQFVSCSLILIWFWVANLTRNQSNRPYFFSLF